MVHSAPTIHVLGDSISMHYGPFLKAYLGSQAKYSRKEHFNGVFESPEGSNGQDSVCVLRYLEQCVTHCCYWDYLFVNCGLHDIRVRPNLGHQVPAAQYKGNLENICEVSSKVGSHVYWITTTPVWDEHHNAIKCDYKRYSSDVISYNALAYEVMSAHNIPMVDLHFFTSAAGGVELLLDHIHFTPTTRMLQAAFLSGVVREILRRDGR